MRKQWQSLVLLITACIGLAAPASAVPVVVPDSTYVIYLQGLESGNEAAGIFRFDGIPETIPRGNSVLTVNETETVIDATSSQIIITLSSTAELFPVQDEVALLGLGTFGDGLDLLFPVRLADARISFIDALGTLVTRTDNLVPQVTQTNPWDGLFPNAFELVGVEGAGGRDVRTVSFEFLVTTQGVPEPGVVLLSGIGLLALVGARRRKLGTKRL